MLASRTIKQGRETYTIVLVDGNHHKMDSRLFLDLNGKTESARVFGRDAGFTWLIIDNGRG